MVVFRLIVIRYGFCVCYCLRFVLRLCYSIIVCCLLTGFVLLLRDFVGFLALYLLFVDGAVWFIVCDAALCLLVYVCF